MGAGKYSKLAQTVKLASGSAQTLTNGQSLLMLDPEQIIVEKQVRKNLKNIPELADSIENQGQQQPIIVRPAPGQRDTYILEKGERRLAACKLKGLQVAAIVSNAHYNSITAHAGQLVENIQRDNLEAFEIADGLQRFLDEPNSDWSQRKIAEYIGKPRGYVSLYLSLVKASDNIRDLADREIVKDAETLNKLRQLVELEPEWEKELLNQLEKQKTEEDKLITRAQIRNWLVWAKEAVELGVKPSEYIAQQETARNEINNAPEQAPGAEGPGTTRPGLNVGVGTLLDGHKGPLAGEDEDTEIEPVNVKTSTTTTTTKTTMVEEQGEDDLDAEEDGYQGEQGGSNTPESGTNTSNTSDSTQPPRDPLPEPASAPEVTKKAPVEAKSASKWPILHDGYLEYAVGQLAVRVEVGDQQGELLTNIMDDEPDYLWVLINDEQQRVHVDDVRIACMEPHAVLEK